MMAHACGVPGALFTLLYKDVPLILTLQEGDPPEYIERTMRPLWPLFKRAFTHARTIQVISTFLGDWARRMGCTTNPIRIPNGVHVAHFMKRASDEELSEIQHRLGKKRGDVLLITTSRLVRKNGIDTVIQALALLPHHVHFIIFGNGPDAESLRALAQSLGVADRTHFMGTISHRDMPPYIQACDIFIRPSRSEGMGNSFVEAMAAGVPVIATQAGGIADFLFDAKRNPEQKPTGWAVDIDAPEQIRDAVLEICVHKDVVREVTEHARASVEHAYDWNTVAASMKTHVFDATLK
jgi:glycosyltransferase involved in cell wall biosynthesis